MSITKKEKQQIFNRLWKEDKWTDVRKHLFKWLKEEPDNHWLLTQIAESYYLQHHHVEALEYAEKAWRIAPRCPLAIWEYSEALFYFGKVDEAEPLYRSLIHRGAKRIANGECGEGIRAARTLVNDSRYSLGIIWANKDDFALAKRYIKKHIANRSPSCTSTFKIMEVKKDLALILQSKKPNFPYSTEACIGAELR